MSVLNRPARTCSFEIPLMLLSCYMFTLMNPQAKNEGADWPAHVRRPICAVICRIYDQCHFTRLSSFVPTKCLQ